MIKEEKEDASHFKEIFTFDNFKLMMDQALQSKEDFIQVKENIESINHECTKLS